MYMKRRRALSTTRTSDQPGFVELCRSSAGRETDRKGRTPTSGTTLRSTADLKRVTCDVGIREMATQATLSAADILTLGHGFMNAKVLLAAVKLRLFDVLQQRPLTGSQIGERLGLHARAIPDFPDALRVIRRRDDLAAQDTR